MPEGPKTWAVLATGFGLFTAGVTYVPILLGLLTANPAPDDTLHVIGALAAAIAGAVAGVRRFRDARTQSEDAARLATASDQLRTSREAAEAEQARLEAEKARLEKERADAARSIGALSPALLALTRERSESQVNMLIEVILQELYQVLGDRGPRRVFFLEYCAGSDATVSFVLRGRKGYRTDTFDWTIDDTDEENVTVARDLLAKRVPWTAGRLLVADVADASSAQFYRLPPPDLGDADEHHGTISCWYRTALVLDEERFGILGVDAWEPHALRRVTDETVIDSFGRLLTVGLLANKYASVREPASDMGTRSTGHVTGGADHQSGTAGAG